MFCIQCGAPAAQGAKFCQRCGNALAAEAAPPGGMPPTADASDDRPRHADTPATPPPPRALPRWSAPPTNLPPTSLPRPLIFAAAVGGVLLLLCVAGAVGRSLLGGGGSGAGKVVFGTDYRQTKNGFEIVGPRTTFGPSDQFAFVATFKEKAGTTDLDVLLTYLAPGGGERVVDRSEFSLADPRYTQVTQRYRAGELLYGQAAGTYKLKFLRESTLLAEGTFTYDPAR